MTWQVEVPIMATSWPGHRAGGGRRDVGIDVPDARRRSPRAARSTRRPAGVSRPARRPRTPIRVSELVVGEGSKPGSPRPRSRPMGRAVLKDALVASGADVADVSDRTAARRSSRPPRSSAPVRLVQLRILLQQLQAPWPAPIPRRGFPPKRSIHDSPCSWGEGR